ncbi:MAG: type-F conjugative transfer system secretin TraK [Alphaproteobacteria bacterium]|nr:type-F conjugative transfer system secretin TraK [Alphaproteobacteria bacterium]
MVSRFLISLLAGSAAHAAIVRSLDEMKVIEVPISQQGLTRIKVQDDRILHVFGNAGEYALETDENQGQIFIRPTPLEGTSSKPISFTLTTELGHTQDLRLLPKDRAPEALVLKMDTTLQQEIEQERRASAPLFREEVESLIFALQEERIPLGYKEMPISLTTLNESYQRIRELQGQTLRGFTYHIQNKTQTPQVLSESDLAKALPFNPNKIIALLLSKKTLTPGEGTEIYVVARAN